MTRLAVLTTMLVLASGCGDKEPEFPENPTPSATTPPPPPVATTPPPPASAPCDAVQGMAISTIVTGRAKAEAPRMDTEGAPVCGTVSTEGGTFDGPTFFMQPGFCYTVLANSLPNVTELDVQIVADATAAGVPPALAALAAQPIAVDSDGGTAAAIGSGTACYKWPWPLPLGVKLVLKSRMGQGPMGAQVYKRKL